MFDLFEILIESGNPHAVDPLNDAEARSLRLKLADGETPLAFLRGRAVGQGPALWVLTATRLLCLSRGRVDAMLLLNQITGLDKASGRYGTTLGLRQVAARRAVYGADRALAAAFVACLVQQAPALAGEVALQALSSEEATEVTALWADARVRVHPHARRSAADILGLLGDAEAMRARGVLDEAEFTLLKGRLLEAA